MKNESSELDFPFRQLQRAGWITGGCVTSQSIHLDLTPKGYAALKQMGQIEKTLAEDGHGVSMTDVELAGARNMKRRVDGRVLELFSRVQGRESA